jgi:hypothetical protein
MENLSCGLGPDYSFVRMILMFLGSRREDKSSGLNGSKHYPNSISSRIKFYFITIVPKYLDYATFAKYLLATVMS